MANGTFGPTQKGFDAKNPHTWSKAFREQVLGIWYERDSDSYDTAYGSTKGVGVEMLLLHQAHRPRVFVRQTNDVLAKVRPTTE